MLATRRNEAFLSHFSLTGEPFCQAAGCPRRIQFRGLALLTALSSPSQLQQVKSAGGQGDQHLSKQIISDPEFLPCGTIAEILASDSGESQCSYFVTHRARPAAV